MDRVGHCSRAVQWIEWAIVTEQSSGESGLLLQSSPVDRVGHGPLHGAHSYRPCGSRSTVRRCHPPRCLAAGNC